MSSTTRDVGVKLQVLADVKGVAELEHAFAQIGPAIEQAMKDADRAAAAAGDSLKHLAADGGGAAAGMSDLGEAAAAASTKGKGLGGMVPSLGAVKVAAVAAGAAMIGLGVAAYGGIKDSIKAAEDLGDAQARAAGVFGDDNSVTEWASRNANALGLTKTAYIEATAKAGDFLDGLGLQGPALTDMSRNLTDLAPKLAAFTGQDASSVTDALIKGVGGATKGLKEMGIVIPDIPKGLDEAAKATFIYDEILKQSGAAQKAWAGNSGDMDMSMARITAAVTDAKAAIGTALLPVLAPLAEKFAGLASTLTGAVGPAMDVLKAAFSGDWSQQSSTALETIRSTLGPLGEVLISAAISAGNLGASFKALLDGDPSEAVDRLLGSLDQLVDVIGELAGIDMTAIKEFLFGAEDAEDWGGVFGDIKVAVTGAVSAFESLTAPISDVISLSDILIPIIGTALVAAFGAWAIAAGSAAVATITALAPVLIPIALIGAAIAVLKAAWEKNWGGIREKTAAVVDWLKANAWPLIEDGIMRVKQVIADLQPTVEVVFGMIRSTLAGVVNWFSENGESLKQIFTGVWSVLYGLVSGAMALITGIVRAAMALLRGDFDGAGRAMQSAISGAVQGIARALGGLVGIVVGALKLVLSNVIPAARAIGRGIIDGITFVLKGGSALIWGAVKGLVGGLVGAVKTLLGIASPSTVFAELAMFAVEGLAKGFDDNAQKAIEAASRVATGVASAAKGLVELFTTLASKEAQRSTEGLADRFKTLVAALAPIRRLLAGLGDSIGDDEGKALENASKSLTGIAGAVRAVADAFIALGPRESSKGGLLATVIPDEGIIRSLQDRMRLLLSIAQDLTTNFAAGVGFVGLELITGAISAMASALKSVSDIDLAGTAGIAERDMNLAVAAINRVVAAVGPIVAEFIKSTGSEDVRDAVAEGSKRWQETVSSMAAALKSVADLKFVEVSSLTQGLLDTVRGNLVLISAAFGGLLAEFINMDRGQAGTTEVVATGAKRWQETVGAMASAVASLLDASQPLEDVTSLTPSVLSRVTRSYEVIRDGLKDLIAAWAAMEQAAPGSQEVVSSSAKTWADTVSSMVKVVADILKIEVPETLGFDAVRGLIDPIKDFAVAALTAVQAAAVAWRGALTGGELERLAASIKAWTDGVGASVKIIADISKLENPDFLAVQNMNDPVLLSRLIDFAQLALTLVSQAAAGFRTLTAETRDKLTGSIKAWTDSAGAAVKLLADVGGIGDLSGAPDLSLIQGLADWARGALDAITSRMVVLQPSDLDNIKVFVEGSGAAVKMLSGLSKDLEGIKEAAPPSPGLIARLSESAKLILVAVRDALATLTSDELTKITTGGGALEAANKGLASLSAALAAIMDNPFMSLSRRRSSFSKDVFKRRLTESIRETVQTLSDALASVTFNDTALEQLGKFGDAWSSMADSLAKISAARIDMSAIRNAAAAAAILAASIPAGGGGLAEGMTLAGQASGAGLLTLKTENKITVNNNYNQYGDNNFFDEKATKLMLDRLGSFGVRPHTP